MGVTTEVTTGGIMEATMEGIMAVITEATMEASVVASAEDSDTVALEAASAGDTDDDLQIPFSKSVMDKNALRSRGRSFVQSFIRDMSSSFGV
ncbi:uncharacterized protein LOC134771448 isoform X1 [Penaeus indicus]|uniref:uncharacterized protein LOC134771448 isoform X1 n=1 Tax=Penaeus indicus TaxID=29960 RepID=UPI00300DAC0E